MKVDRRQFLKMTGASSVGSVLFWACGIPEDDIFVQSPVDLPEDLVTGTDAWYATLCRNCPTNEGVIVRVMEGRAKKVEGNPEYPVNMGKHGVRCEAGLQAHHGHSRTYSG